MGGGAHGGDHHGHAFSLPRCKVVRRKEMGEWAWDRERWAKGGLRPGKFLSVVLFLLLNSFLFFLYFKTK